MHAFHHVERGGGELFTKLSQRSALYRIFSNDQDLRDGHRARIHRQACRELDRLAEHLRALSPDLIVADNHVFTDHSRHLVAVLRARLIFNRAAGTLLVGRSVFERTFGITSVPKKIQVAVEWAGQSSARLRNRWHNLRHPERVLATAERENRFTENMVRLFGRPPASVAPTLTTNLGLCTLQPLSPPRAHEIFLHVPPEATGPALPPSLTEWLDQHSGNRIVYVGFGSMVWPEKAMVQKVIAGLSGADVIVIWALPGAQREWLDTALLAPRFRFEEFAPQKTLLMSGKVSCFVTHCGSGGVQESLLSGVPMLCIPFIWDQPYTASFIARIGAGNTLRRGAVNSQRVRDGLCMLISDPGYAASAREASARLTAQDVHDVEWIDQLISVPQAAPRDLPCVAE